MEQFSRTEALLGADNMKKLATARIAIFGIGGVGGYTVEALARCGIGHFNLIDRDVVSMTNINRQIIATIKSIGQNKVDVMKERILDINPFALVKTYPCFFLPENASSFDFSSYDYIVDAVDTISAKIELVVRAKDCGVPIISCMGAGNKLDPTKFEVADLSKTSVCPLAKVMRKELRLRGIEHVKVVYSKELPIKPEFAKEETDEKKRGTPGSISFSPSVAGLILASEVVKDLLSPLPEQKINFQNQK